MPAGSVFLRLPTRKLRAHAFHHTAVEIPRDALAEVRRRALQLRLGLYSTLRVWTCVRGVGAPSVTAYSEATSCIVTFQILCLCFLRSCRESDGSAVSIQHESRLLLFDRDLRRPNYVAPAGRLACEVLVRFARGAADRRHAVRQEEVLRFRQLQHAVDLGIPEHPPRRPVAAFASVLRCRSR